jgi:hydrogenase-4 component E
LHVLTTPLDAFCGGFFLLTAISIVATRQMLACLRLYMVQSLFLAIAAVLIGIELDSGDLIAVAVITLLTKVIAIPWVLKYTLGAEIYDRREIDQVLSIPLALLISAALILFCYFVATPMVRAVGQPFTNINLPIGLAGLVLGTFTVTVRREAIAQLMGLLAMENGVFFASISIVPHLPIIAEISAAIDVPILSLIIGLLVRRIHKRVGSTTVGALTSLRED